MARRRQLVSMLVSERNRLATSHKVARRRIQAIIRTLTRQLEDIEGELARHIAHQHPDLAALLSSVKGMGNTTVATLIADVPELGHFSRWEISALIGVAPLMIVPAVSAVSDGMPYIQAPSPASLDARVRHASYQRSRKRRHTATANFARIGYHATFEMNDATDCASDE